VADRHVDVLLVGGGVAGASCAEALRRAGFDGSVLLCGREPDPPYNRPPASKGYLAGASSREDALYHPEGWYAAHGVELLTRVSVMKLDTAAMEATLSTKETVGFGHALLATGANVRRLPVEGSDLDGIHYLRALRNADAIRDDVAAAERVLLVGGSYVGCEVAATLTGLGKRCTVLMQEELPLSRGFGDTAGRYFDGLLRERGVDVVGGATLAALEGDDGRVARAVLEDGRALEADAVVFGVGAVPDVMLARSAGLELGEHGGIACSPQLQSSAPGIYAAGDVCQYESVLHGGRPVRIEHWDVAIAHGRTVAANIMGEGRAHDVVPYFWSDLADWATLESVGFALDPVQQEIVRGSVEDGAFSLWQLSGGRVATVLSVGRREDLEHARRLIATGTPVGDGARIADTASDLAAL
jgi:3-phenylpropionate/trans-cinnamate dioxygenase ferredoxin reductase subunit